MPPTHITSLSDYYQLQHFALQNSDKFWNILARQTLKWQHGYARVFDDSCAPFYSWFRGGKLNITDQCIARHLPLQGDKTAIIWEGEHGSSRKITYKQLAEQTSQLTYVLQRKFGIRQGDRVALYMPMIPEAVVAMMACAKIGAVHVVVFGGFSATALKERIIDVDAKLIITADGASRRGKPYLLKPVVDAALDGDTTGRKVLMMDHNHQPVSCQPGRDFLYRDLVTPQPTISRTARMDSESPLFILHTSGSTGKPKGIVHTTAGYILWAQYTCQTVFALQRDDIFWCTADIGWITGHTYTVYGPLAVGATIVLYEGAPTFPNAGRWWEIIQKHRVTQFYTAPTALRLLKKADANAPKRYNLRSLKVIGSVGEPIHPTEWQWYSNAIGGGRCPVVDTWWQTETGGHVVAPIAGVTPLTPGSATLPLPGIQVEILDTAGKKVAPGQKGLLCITKPWPSMLRGVWGDTDRYSTTYFAKKSANGAIVYSSGDMAKYDKNGNITITGRTDDIINISGHRVGATEVESVLIKHADIAEAGIVSRPHAITGEQLVAYVVAKTTDQAALLADINLLLRQHIGAIVKIGCLTLVPGLPKTRSGKVMRRVLKAIARGEEITQDTTTLDDPSLVATIQQLYGASRI